MQNYTQKTINETIELQGVGLHNGVKVNLVVKPADPNTGIIFKRVDLDDNNIIKAKYDNVIEPVLCTKLKNSKGISVSTIEHLMAALSGSGVDNVDIEINGPEVPIMDGSSKQFIDLIENAGLSKLSEKRKFLKITKHIEIIDGEKKCSLSPSNNMNFFASIDFSDKVIGKQEASISLENFNFKDNVSNARTFGFMRDVEALRMSGLGLGGSLDNCIIIDNNEVIQDCYDATKHIDGTNRSNMGGWQSEVRPLTTSVFKGSLRYIYDLGSHAVEFANRCIDDLHQNAETHFTMNSAHLWVNINNDQDYNVLHSHPGADLIVLYYALYEGPEQGVLRLVRTDGSNHTQTYSGTIDSMDYAPDIEQGALIAFPPHLLHYVTPNITGRDRISISFNLTVDYGDFD